MRGVPEGCPGGKAKVGGQGTLPRPVEGQASDGTEFCVAPPGSIHARHPVRPR